MVIRVAEPGRPAFQLRKGEEGLSVFLFHAVVPPLEESEVLGAFRPGSVAIVRSMAEIEAKGLAVVSIPGTEPLPARLQQAHGEIRPGPEMSRPQFKAALKELE
jgi:hypothetical protein